MASHSPMTIEQLSELFEEAQRPTHNELAQALESLSLDCAERGVELVEVASGFRFQIKAAAHALVSRLWTERQSKYSRALLETLALIAYRQPITRAEIEAVRGVAVSSHIVRTLEEREWIRVVGHREVPGRPALYGTTRGFLDYFKLKSLEDLPTLSEIKDFEEIAPELEFPSLDGAPSNAAADNTVSNTESLATNDAETSSDQSTESARDAELDGTELLESAQSSEFTVSPVSPDPADVIRDETYVRVEANHHADDQAHLDTSELPSEPNALTTLESELSASETTPLSNLESDLDTAPDATEADANGDRDH